MTGTLYRNLYSNNGQLAGFLSALNSKSFQNPTIIKPTTTDSIYADIIVLLSQLPVGMITPNSPYVNSDYILTFENLGTLDIFGLDFGLQYNVYESQRHLVQIGASVDWVDKDQIALSTGGTVPLNAPKAKCSVTFDHTLKKSGFGYGLSFRYAMPYDAASSIYEGHVDPMYILDARVSYRLKQYKGLLLSINVNNVNNYQWAAFPGAPLMGTQAYFRAQITF
jgi:hypothetical protein